MMTPETKFRKPNMQFASSGTGMTERDKFEDRWHTLVKIKCNA